MSKLLADVFVSVDGCASGAQSPGYFGFDGPDLQQWIADEQAVQRLDVMGRKTYEMLSGLPEEHRDESWHKMSRRPALVFSRTLSAARWPGVELCSRDVVDEVRDRRASNDPDLRTIGSLSLVRQLLRAELVDSLRLMIFPIVVSDTGQEQVFHDVGDFQLGLTSCRVLDDRVVLLEYRPAGPPPRR